MSVTEFLAQALPPQGSADLPYKPEQWWTVRQHITDLVEVCISTLANKPPPPPARSRADRPRQQLHRAPLKRPPRIPLSCVHGIRVQEVPTLVPRKQLYTHHDGRRAAAQMTCWMQRDIPSTRNGLHRP